MRRASIFMHHGFLFKFQITSHMLVSPFPIYLPPFYSINTTFLYCRIVAESYPENYRDHPFTMWKSHLLLKPLETNGRRFFSRKRLELTHSRASESSSCRSGDHSGTISVSSICTFRWNLDGTSCFLQVYFLLSYARPSLVLMWLPFELLIKLTLPEWLTTWLELQDLVCSLHGPWPGSEKELLCIYL